ncbi:DUF3817 domain-containing protein [Bacillus cytotoxicus]|uniref:Conserved hypothetical membrane spanning protein n=1 Tax=Bacillus cytotoxicus (strain DSM 22905 / CIP 110041 / 391-98 / NVH 391-98) TaxID=315749 RepID=A7GVE4_BACCN|nr:MULTISPECIES: DUF3817 domain-containing protein [Bacillus cereus group]ABS24102.1 conserved hypothetical membrane spanning protein [Bacillus cytotoxicus NVH 391-98]AWC30671.1 DUF3817 domain-containing protein [Bacillus cytotoxicus]AWC34729.1 DUF3817 domain-containing protein [Bacillus cytotoxicus]AWC38722.1 DUF3817 domain-containing protein [Bacillus cytotoxicus]AWC42812.1 DUF3817 domain-containing protein [Bacillus cytotoxicus]
MLSTPVGRLRAIGFVEGISFLLLLFVAMPLKYFAGFAAAVKITGMAHGVLFILFIFAVIQVTIANRKSILWVLGALLASVIPFGTFVLDAKLKNEQ